MTPKEAIIYALALGVFEETHSKSTQHLEKAVQHKDPRKILEYHAKSAITELVGSVKQIFLIPNRIYTLPRKMREK